MKPAKPELPTKGNQFLRFQVSENMVADIDYVIAAVPHLTASVDPDFFGPLCDTPWIALRKTATCGADVLRGNRHNTSAQVAQSLTSRNIVKQNHIKV